MTQDQGLCPEEIIKLAKEAGISEWSIGTGESRSSTQGRRLLRIERFANLIADAKKQQLIDLCEREIQRLSIEQDEARLGNGQYSCGITGFDEGLYAAYHTILKELLK